MANAQCSVSTEADKIEIKVISGKISVTASEKGEKIILSQGQNWTPEQDAIDKVGTLLISPDSEDITVE
jgi:ferric-dicitrate binding protein FerR (iron transport regulator)